MNTTVTIDVREDIRSGGEPLSKIMNAAAAVRAGGQFLVIAPFEPVPLFKVLEKQGFTHAAQPVAAGDWEVLFTRLAGAPMPVSRSSDSEEYGVPPEAFPGARAAMPACFSQKDRAGKAARAPVPSPSAEQLGASPDAETMPAPEFVEVDARGLEPPQPLVKILEALTGLSEGAELHARTDRRPIHLYAQLEERGFTAETMEQSDGSFLTHVRRC